MVEVTPAARIKIQDLLSEENNLNLKLRTFVQGGGCSGFSYGFTFDDVQNDDDFEIPVGSWKMVVDAMSMQYLNGAEIDYKEDIIKFYISQSKLNFFFQKIRNRNINLASFVLNINSYRPTMSINVFNFNYGVS